MVYVEPSWLHLRYDMAPMSCLNTHFLTFRLAELCSDAVRVKRGAISDHTLIQDISTYWLSHSLLPSLPCTGTSRVHSIQCGRPVHHPVMGQPAPQWQADWEDGIATRQQGWWEKAGSRGFLTPPEAWDKLSHIGGMCTSAERQNSGWSRAGRQPLTVLLAPTTERPKILQDLGPEAQPEWVGIFKGQVVGAR